MTRFYTTDSTNTWSHFLDRTIQKQETDQPDARHDPSAYDQLSNCFVRHFLLCVLEHETTQGEAKL